MKRTLWVENGVLALLLLIVLAGCSLPQSGTIQPPDSTSVSNEESPSGSDREKEKESEDTWQLDPDTITDEYILQEIVGIPEIALVDNGFTFDSPDALSSEKLYMLFLIWTDYDKLETCQNPDDQWFYFSEEMIRETLDQYFKEYTFDITACKGYDTDSGCIATPIASGFGGDLDIRLVDKQFDQNIGTFTMDFHQNLYNDGRSDTEVYQRKVYTVEFYEGGLYYLSAQMVPAN